MIKQHAIMVKKKELSNKEFSDYLRVVHGGYGLQVDEYPIRYAQFHRLPYEIAGLPSAPENMRGVSQGWFENISDAEKLMENRTFIQGAIADMPNFAEAGPLLVSQEKVVKEWNRFHTDRPCLGSIIFFNWASKHTIEQMDSALNRLTHEVTNIPGIVHAVVCPALMEKQTGAISAPYAGAIEIWWREYQHFEVTANSKQFSTFISFFMENMDDATSHHMVGEYFRMRWR